MSLFRRSFRSEGGFSLIEVMAAITVFAAITLGITPLLVSSMRGSTLARSYTVGKNLGLEAMERVRGLPYFDTAPARDVLDLYFPDLSTPGYDATAMTFTTVCTATSASPTASGARACPPDHPDATTSRIPSGYTLTYVARFVTPVATTPETYTTAPPPAGYDAADPAAATPPGLTELAITVSWSRLGQPRSFTLRSLLGQRKLSVNRLSARASIDFVAQALTAFEEDDGRLSSIKAVAGKSSSDIEVRGFAAADQDTSAGELILTQNEFGGDPGTVLAEMTGAEVNLHAPPNSTAPDVVTKLGQTVTHGEGLDSLEVGHLGTSSVNESTPAPSTLVNGEYPKTTGNFALTTGTGTKSFWIRNQSPGTLLKLLGDDSDFFPFYIERATGDKRVSGNTYAEATAPTPPETRKVEATLHGESSTIHLFPTSYAPEGVVRITNFAMDLACKSTGVLGTSTATGSWSATFEWWNDGSYFRVPVPNGTIGGSSTNAPGTADPLDQWHIDNNPLVRAGSLLLGPDIYLFNDPVRGRRGFIESWETTTVVPTSTSATRAEADLPFAINIQTAPTDSSIPETALSITIGKATCFAEDLR